MRLIENLLRDEAGATAIEYGLLAAFVGVALVTAMQSLGNSLTNTYNTVGSKMNSANTTASA
ncbi:Flp family type IVb pilin [Novosphingobium sp.]|uniref:Flp family type IVb pilin n=1 Tax=Novosphingobium sp. TaxID=1874826 RepID=UPI0025F313CE|nr:Flp family type IVb pilin [Novosphingobium sp.]